MRQSENCPLTAWNQENTILIILELKKKGRNNLSQLAVIQDSNPENQPATRLARTCHFLLKGVGHPWW